MRLTTWSRWSTDILRDDQAWQSILNGLQKDPHGPKIDLRKELIEHLGTRVSLLTDYKVPITTTSERLMIAVEIKPGRRAGDGRRLAKFYKNDREMRKREFEKHVVWEAIVPEKGKEDVPEEIDVDPVSPAQKKAAHPRTSKGKSSFPTSP